MMGRLPGGAACVVFLAIVLHGCAGQVEPGGGPRDTVPPFIVRTEPDTNAVHVDRNSVGLEFSEYVDRRSVEESIFISPYVGELEFDWSGTEVTVHFSEHLRKNTTYVVNVGTDVIDLREKNRMAAAYTLAFSTGDSIDRGSIGGRVFDEKPEGIMIFAYALKDLHPDTLNPADVKPDYITQTGTGGTFRLANLAFGPYRLFAVRDQYRNLIYDRQVDQYGVAISDFVLDAATPRIDAVQFKLSEEDTTKPFVTSVQVTNRTLLWVKFSEPLDTLPAAPPTAVLEDTLEHIPVRISLIAISNRTPSLSAVVTTAPLDSGKAYRIRVDGVHDQRGNPVDTLNASYVFVPVAGPDTVRPSLILPGLRDSLRGVALDGSFQVGFSEPVVQPPVPRAIALKDSTGKTVDAAFRWLDPMDVLIVPRNQLQSKSWYSLRVSMDSLRDFQGNGYRDSMSVVHFETLDLKLTGVIEGTVVDDRAEKGKGRIHLTASGIDTKPPRERTIVLARPGPFTLDRLVEGKYTIQAFRDADDSGNYTYGRPYPFIPSERFTVYPDTLKVRARWGVEGVSVRFK